MSGKLPSITTTAEDGVGEVVLRNPKKTGFSALIQEEMGRPGEKRVKWSESTELREKMKVYRRSQMDIPLDYHHIAVEEQREKVGVKEWRSSIHKDDDDDDEETASEVVSPTDASGVAESESESTDSEEREPEPQVDLDLMLHVIKIKTTKYTVYPAYHAAVNTYEVWLSDSSNTKNVCTETLNSMKCQLELYKAAVSLYERWADQDDDKTSCAIYEDIDAKLKSAANLGPPPEAVSKIINDVLSNEANAQKQVEVYNVMVQDMITSLDSIEV